MILCARSSTEAPTPAFGSGIGSMCTRRLALRTGQLARGALAPVRLGLAVPAAQGFGADAELPRDRSDRLARGVDERDRVPVELLGVPLRVLASHLVLLPLEPQDPSLQVSTIKGKVQPDGTGTLRSQGDSAGLIHRQFCESVDRARRKSRKARRRTARDVAPRSA